MPASVLPEVRRSDEALGSVRGLGPAIDGTPIVAGLVDQPAALFGQGCLAAGQAKATYGTGCFVYLNTGGSPRPSAHGLLTTIAWQRAAGTVYALDGGVFADRTRDDDEGQVQAAPFDQLQGGRGAELR